MNELLSNLGINGWLLGAQVVNFLILLFVLNKFVYKPLLAYIEKRKQLIQEGIENAQKIDERLEEIKQKESDALTRARKEAQKIIDKAKKSGEEEAQALAVAAEKRIESMVAAAKAKLSGEQERMLKEANETISSLVVDATKKVLTSVGSDEVQGSIISSAVKKAK